jgi:peptide/nickel transport system substrate-binding protein
VYGEASPVAEAALSRTLLPIAFEEPYPGFDPDQAGRRLEAAGWILDRDGLRYRNGERLSLAIVTPNWGGHVEVAQLIEAAWEAVGAEVSLEVAPGFGLLREAHDRNRYNLIGINFFGTDPDVLRPMFSSGGLYNWMNLEDPALDDLLHRAASQTQDAAARDALYAQALAAIRRQSLILPVRDYVNLVVASDRVRGVSFSYQGWFPLLHDIQPAP